MGFGTWVAFGTGRVLVAIDPGDPDFDTAGEMVGAKTISPDGSVSAPTFTGAALGVHQHGTGTLAPSAHSGAAVADHVSHTHGYTEVVNHNHPVNITDPEHTHVQNAHVHTQRRNATATGANTGWTTAFDTSSSVPAADLNTGTGSTTPTNQNAPTGITAGSSNPAGGVASGITQGPSATLSHGVTQPGDHTMAGASEALSAGTPAGSVSAPIFTGTPGSVVQPSIVVYVWTRTA